MKIPNHIDYSARKCDFGDGFALFVGISDAPPRQRVATVDAEHAQYLAHAGYFYRHLLRSLRELHAASEPFFGPTSAGPAASDFRPVTARARAEWLLEEIDNCAVETTERAA